MPTTNEAVHAVWRHLGFEKPRVAAVARSLTDAGVLPAGGPGRSPELEPQHVVDIILAVAVDAPLRALAAKVAEYRAMTPGGACLVGAPDSIDTAGRMLDILGDWSIHGDADLLRRDAIEVVSSWPEIALHDYAAAQVRRFAPVGTLASHWQNSGHRRSTCIHGSAFVNAMRELFGESK
jgi:hypothetical protein